MASSDSGSDSALLTTAELARRPDFKLGEMLVSPSRRTVTGPGGSADLEPRVMQVLVVLADGAGEVVTRRTLFDRCWGSLYVGEDSLNRAISAVRRIADEVGGGCFQVETIPRTGYRLQGAVAGPIEQSAPLTRRKTLALAAGVSAAVAGGTWWMTAKHADPRATVLTEKAEQILRTAVRGGAEEAARLLREAVKIEPRGGRAWGLLALALRDVAEEANPEDVSRAVIETETAAKRALSIDSADSNARIALATVRPEFGNWGQIEDSLVAILEDSPESVPAMSYLVMILQAVGRARDSWDYNERALTVDALSPVLLFRRALKLWIFGRVPEADVAGDRALQLWPRHAAVWNARMMIFAFTGRAHAALATLENAESRPPDFSKAAIGFWRTSLQALDSGQPGDVDAAVRVNLQAAPTSPYFAHVAMMVLSSLGRVDEAFAVAEGTLLRKGKLIGTLWAGKKQMAVYDQYWRRTMNLFTPATAAMRADPRFKSLCDGMGMTDYWRRRGVAPDRMYGLDFI